MLEVKWTNAFKKEFKQMKKRGYDINKLKDIVEMLQKGKSLPAKYRPHSLSGKYHDVMECHIENDWLLMYQIKDNELILYLLRTGTHSDLFEH